MSLVEGGAEGSGGSSLTRLEEGQNDSEQDLIHLSKVRRGNDDSVCVEGTVYMCHTCMYHQECMKCTPGTARLYYH